jgi:glycosyltransferase involved in cell wall biosynthesis
MYYYSGFDYNPQRKKQLTAPNIESTKEISIVIPVRDNQTGINSFLSKLLGDTSSEFPLEVIIVQDHGSPIEIQEKYQKTVVDLKVLQSEKFGPASARNLGYRSARGNWILFTDSDCIPAKDFLRGYLAGSNGSVGYAGNVKSLGEDVISKYYESQRILIPSANICNYPDYLITANSLVWKKALEEVGGFNEEIKIAAGEDIDLGFRLREIGTLSFAPSSVFHNFDDGLVGFIQRFIRYGNGDHHLSARYGLNIKPRLFKPANVTGVNSILALLQYLSMLYGWYSNSEPTHKGLIA